MGKLDSRQYVLANKDGRHAMTSIIHSQKGTGAFPKVHVAHRHSQERTLAARDEIVEPISISH